MADEQELLDEINARRPVPADDLADEVRRRITAFGDIRLDTPVRRQAFAELLAAYEVAPYRLIVDPNDTGANSQDMVVSLNMLLIDEASGTEPVAHFKRAIHLNEGVVLHERLSVTEAYRNRAITPRLMLSSFDLYDRLGLNRVVVHAALTSGRYYWSGKVGYQFLREEDRRHVERWATFVLGALGKEIDLGGLVTPQHWALLGTTSDAPPTASFADLAGAISRVSVVLLDPREVGVVGAVDASDMLACEGMVDLERHLQAIASANGIAWTDPVPLGKLIMLSGPDWWGCFDLKDPVARQSFATSAAESIARSEDPSEPEG